MLFGIFVYTGFAKNILRELEEAVVLVLQRNL